MWWSVPHTVAATTLTTSPPGSGSGISTSRTSSGRRYSTSTAASAVAMASDAGEGGRGALVGHAQAPQGPGFGGVEVGPGVEHGVVVPHDQVTLAPDVLVAELRPVELVEELLQERSALGRVETHQTVGHESG